MGLIKKTKIQLLAAFLIPVIIISIGISGYAIYFHKDTISKIREKAEIVILKDKDFIDLYNFSGKGTEKEPYLIENLKFIQKDKGGIIIQDTTKYFTIQNCSFEKNCFSIFIANTAFGTTLIQNNTCLINTISGDELMFYGYIDGSNVRDKYPLFEEMDLGVNNYD